MKALDFYKKKMQPEIEDLFERLYKKISENTEAFKIYNGWQVWFSNIIEYPDILFIGNNPNNVKNDPDFEPHDKLDYINDDNPWDLKDSTVDLFSDSSISNHFDLTRCVKTNYYYMATSNGKSLENLRDILEKQSNCKDLVDEFNRKSREWTKQIIKLLKPKFIFCEGVTAFDLVIKYALDENYNRDKTKDVIFYQPKDNSIKIIGYSRNIDSSIKNPSLLIETLRNIVKN